MEEKLYLRNRGDGDYFLESRTNNSASVVGSLNPTHFAEHKLSLKNCQAIELGYDSGELAHENAIADKTIHLENGLHRDSQYIIGLEDGFRAGFQKALEILGDKKFSEEDMRKAYFQGDYDALYDGAYSEKENKFIQSLQQTEWEVEIEMKTAWIGKCNCPCHSDGVTIMHIMACCHPKMVESPKLDSDGCLILKRK